MLFGFDIEIASPFPEDGHWSDVAPLGVSCAALVSEQETGMVWYSSPGNLAMNPDAVMQMVRYLDYLIRKGHEIITWNGLGFDWRELAFEIGDTELPAKLARITYDPCYAMLKLRGFPIGLDSAAVGCGFEGKRKEVGGEQAVSMWHNALLRPAVMDYCIQDARITMQIGQYIREHGYLKWITKSNRISDQDISLLPTRYYMRLAMPDQSWMDDPPNEDGFVGWLED